MGQSLFLLLEQCGVEGANPSVSPLPPRSPLFPSWSCFSFGVVTHFQCMNTSAGSYLLQKNLLPVVET